MSEPGAGCCFYCGAPAAAVHTVEPARVETHQGETVGRRMARTMPLCRECAAAVRKRSPQLARLVSRFDAEWELRGWQTLF